MWPFKKKSSPSTKTIEFYTDDNNIVKVKFGIPKDEDLCYFPSLMRTIFSDDCKHQCENLLKQRASACGSDMLQMITEEFHPKGRKIVWESSEEYRNDLTAMDEAQIREEFGLDDDTEIDLVEDENEPECWIGHTNFDVSLICRTVSAIDGVDVFKQISRHRFIIAVAKLFSFSEVRKNVEERCI